MQMTMAFLICGKKDRNMAFSSKSSHSKLWWCYSHWSSFQDISNKWISHKLLGNICTKVHAREVKLWPLDDSRKLAEFMLQVYFSEIAKNMKRAQVVSIAEVKRKIILFSVLIPRQFLVIILLILCYSGSRILHQQWQIQKLAKVPIPNFWCYSWVQVYAPGI